MEASERVDLAAAAAHVPAWRVVTGREPALTTLAEHSPAVASLVHRVRRLGPRSPAPPPNHDMVHADLNPGNVLVRDGAVVALVDIENAGCGTRATDLTTLQWHCHDATLDETRTLLGTRVVELVGWDGAAVLTATQVLLQLEWPVRLGRPELVPGTVHRGHRALDELESLR